MGIIILILSKVIMESYYKRQEVYQNTAYKRLNNAAEDELGMKIK